MVMAPFTVSALTGPFTPSMDGGGEALHAEPAPRRHLDLEVGPDAVGVALGLDRDRGTVGVAPELQARGAGAEGARHRDLVSVPPEDVDRARLVLDLDEAVGLGGAPLVDGHLRPRGSAREGQDH
jgi:hypothetical protein